MNIGFVLKNFMVVAQAELDCLKTNLIGWGKLNTKMERLFNVLKRLFGKANVSSSKTAERLYLESKIEKAKKEIKFTTCGDMVFVENIPEICKILEYENTLGMAMFIRFYLTKNIDTDKCSDYLLRA